MLVIKYRARPYYDDSHKGIVATQPIKEGMPVWGVGGNDRVFKLADIKALHPQKFEILLQLGIVRLPYSGEWVVCPEFKLVNWSSYHREANLRLERQQIR